MCGRYTLIANAEAIRLLFGVPAFDERLAVPRYNIAPTQPIVVVREGGKGRELVPMRWGLIPWWAKDPAALPLLINARSEEIAQKPAFRDAFRYRRCLIPASGFYEWQAQGEKLPKQPFLVRPQSDEPLAFAGLWETWLGADGSEIDTAAIVTTEANALLAPIHPRMPVMLAREDFAAWLAAGTHPDAAAALLRTTSGEALSAVPVSTRVNSADNDDPGLIEEGRVEPAPAKAAKKLVDPRQPSLF